MLKNNQIGFLYKTFICFLSFFAIIDSGGAGVIAWERDRAELNLAPEDDKDTIVFKGVNRSDHDLRIIKVSVSCGCSTSISRELTVKKGEAFELPVHVKLDSFGEREIDVSVSFKDNPNRDILRIFANKTLPISVVINPSNGNSEIITFRVISSIASQIAVAPAGVASRAFRLDKNIIEPRQSIDGEIEVKKLDGWRFGFLDLKVDGKPSIVAFSTVFGLPEAH